MLFNCDFIDGRKVSLSPMTLFYYDEQFNKDFIEDWTEKIMKRASFGTVNSSAVLKIVYAAEKAYLKGQIVEFKSWCNQMESIDFSSNNFGEFLEVIRQTFFRKSTETERETQEEESNEQSEN